MMRSVYVTQFGGIEQLQVKDDVPVPSIQDNEVLVRVHAAGVNPVDTYLRAGQYKVLPSLPYTPGKDGAGVVIQSKTPKFKAGDRVYFRSSRTGSYAEQTAVPATETWRLEDKLTFSEGAALGVPYFTAYRAIVSRCNVRPGESVLIHGASGAVGLAACQVAGALGAVVYGTAGTEQGEELVRNTGARHVFNHRQQGYLDEIREMTGGLDCIIEMLANVNLEADLSLMKKHGRVGIVGNRGSIEITPRQCMSVESSIIGVMMGMATPAELEETAAFLDAGQKSGWVKPTVGREFTMEQAGLAHTEVIEHSGGSQGKIVITIP